MLHASLNRLCLLIALVSVVGCGVVEPSIDVPDTGTPAGTDAGVDAGTDAGVDAGTDAGIDAGTDAGTDGGTCMPADCDDSNPCTTDTCTASGCTHAPSTGASCDDGNACTQTDACQDGLCIGGDLVTCPAPGVCEEQGICEPSTGQCSRPLLTPGTNCDDDDLATYDDACDDSGTCVGLTVVCPANTDCVTYAPDGSSTCAATPLDATPCDDGDACTQTDTCAEGICNGANPVTCASAGVCQASGVCDHSTGVCSPPTATPGVACDDGNVATYDDTCDGSGTCAGTVVTCPSDDACTTWVPNGTNNCSPVYLDDDPCDDSDPCTATGVCNQGTCDVPAPVTCTNGSTCQNGTCACPAGWTGPTCTTDVDECANNPNICGGGSACTNTPGSYTCSCIQNYSSPTGANCTNAVAALELVFFYDEGAARKLGPNPEARLVEYFNRAKELYDNGLTSPALTLSLNGIVRLSPSPFTMRACNTIEPGSNNCTGCWVNGAPSNCSSPDSTSANEVDVSGLLDSLVNYAHVTRSTRISTFSGGIDVPVLFTDADFASSVVGLAYLAAACNSYSGAVVQLYHPSNVQETALTLTHELGHNLSMQHDPSGTYIMSPTVNTAATSFSLASITAYTDWRTNLGSSDCISDVAHDDWRSHLCGNGKIDPGETCDPGVDPDSCCSSTCQLNPGCLCANTEPCCENGSPRAAGFVCRASSGVCDIADTCDGQSGECRDVWQPVGTTCGNGGSCLEKQCTRSLTEQCSSINNGMYPNSTGCASTTSCSNLYCSVNSTCDIYWSVPPDDGSPCGFGKQCLAGVCVNTASIHEYAWVPGAWSACTNGTSTRTVSCEDERRMTVSNSLCDPATTPATSRTCPL